MLSSLYTAASGMEAAEALHAATAHNLAHAHQAGFRRMLATDQTMLRNGEDSRLENDLTGLQSTQQIDLTTGTLEHTGETLDLALDGAGFFTVQGPAGPLYTRNGVFHLAGDGTIVTSDGLPLAGSNGPIVVPPQTQLAQLTVGLDGSVRVDGNEVGRIELANFEDPTRLESVGVTLFRAPDGLAATDVSASVLQGTIEHSNVSPVGELVALITASRRYEASQRALRSIDESTQKLIARR
ncbi:MAG: flagellar hook basal-body protein [Planctomycetaceae bacterium]|nr:flagellar hook basal-body protein [Planctomycetaceae bacterium]